MDKCVLCQTGLHTHALLTPTTNNSSIITNPFHPIPSLDSLLPLQSLSDIYSTFQFPDRHTEEGHCRQYMSCEAERSRNANGKQHAVKILVNVATACEGFFSECVCDGLILIGDLHRSRDSEDDLSCLTQGKAWACE